MDKTDWLTDKTDWQTDKSNWQIEVSKMTNRSVKNGEPIPDINTNINTDINTDINADSNLTVSKDTVCWTGVQLAIRQQDLPVTYIGLSFIITAYAATSRLFLPMPLFTLYRPYRAVLFHRL